MPIFKIWKEILDYGPTKPNVIFFHNVIEYCGHIIDKNGLHKCKDKTDVVLKVPPPQNVTQLRSFLGLVNYY